MTGGNMLVGHDEGDGHDDDKNDYHDGHLCPCLLL